MTHRQIIESLDHSDIEDVYVLQQLRLVNHTCYTFATPVLYRYAEIFNVGESQEDMLGRVAALEPSDQSLRSRFKHHKICKMAMIPASLQTIPKGDQRKMSDEMSDALKYRFRRLLERVLIAFGNEFYFRALTIYCKNDYHYDGGFLSPLLESYFSQSPSVFLECIVRLFRHEAFSTLRVFKAEFVGFDLDGFMFAATDVCSQTRWSAKFSKRKPFTNIMTELEEIEISYPNPRDFDEEYHDLIGEILLQKPVTKISLQCKDSTFRSWFRPFTIRPSHALAELRLRGFALDYGYELLHTIRWFPNLITLHLRDFILSRLDSELWASVFNYLAEKLNHLSSILFAGLTYTEKETNSVLASRKSNSIVNSSKTKYRCPLISHRQEDVDAFLVLLGVVKQEDKSRECLRANAMAQLNQDPGGS